MKASIRKLDGQWVATRPGYGFGRPEVTTHGSWKAAKEALFGTAVGSAGPVVERAAEPHLMWWPPRGQQIRMEET